MLKFTDIVEMSIQKNRVDYMFPSNGFPFKEFFNSNPVLSSQTEELELLQKINVSLAEFKFKINSDPSNHPQWKLFYLSLCVSERLLEISKLPIIPKTITSLESLKLKMKQECTFDEKGEVLHGVLAAKSLLNLELEFIQGIDKKRHFHNGSAKHAVEFICSFKRLEKLRIKICDSHLTAEGIKHFKKIDKELNHLKSLTIIFQSCPYLTNSSIRSLIQDIDTFYQLERFALVLQICGNVSMEKVAEYKNKMKSHLKEKADITVQPILDFSYMNTS